MQRIPIIGLILGLLGLLVWLLGYWEPTARLEQCEQSPGLVESPVGGDFTLQSAQGPVSLADFRDQVVLLYFGYTWCPDICPTSLGLTSLALESLNPEELARVQSLFVSVDPARDTLTRLEEYAAYFHPKILGLTGTPEQLAETAGRYGAAYRKVAQVSESGYVVDHSADSYLIDPRGRLVEVIPHGTPPPELVALIRRHLAE
jgi:protein SCO1/2